MAHWIIEDKGFGGVVYKCSNCGELWNEYYQSYPKDFCAFCGEDMEDEAEYVEEKHVKKWFTPSPDKFTTDYILDKYESPITMYTQQITAEYNNGIVKAVQSYFPDINKDELAKALKYDRDQYEKGYTDGYTGVRDMKNKIMMEAFHKYTDEYIIYILNELERKGD